MEALWLGVSSMCCCTGLMRLACCRPAANGAGEARYCWQHYIPHRKSDLVAAAQPGGAPQAVPRAQRRVSFTFRQASFSYEPGAW